MPANATPIFPITQKMAWAVLTTANTAMDGTGTVETVYTAGTSGARVDKLRCKSKGTNVASVLRVFANNGSDASTAKNNSLIDEINLPETTSSNSASTTLVDLALDIALPAGYKLNVCIGTTVSAGWHVTAEGGDY